MYFLTITMGKIMKKVMILVVFLLLTTLTNFGCATNINKWPPVETPKAHPSDANKDGNIDLKDISFLDDISEKLYEDKIVPYMDKANVESLSELLSPEGSSKLRRYLTVVDFDTLMYNYKEWDIVKAQIKETMIYIQKKDDNLRDMDWFYKNNGYAVMTITDSSNQPVMEIMAIPLNSEALLALVDKDIANEVNFYVKQWIERQYPVFYLAVHAYRDCCFSWTVIRLQQGPGMVRPQKVLPAKSSLVVAASKLMEKYGVAKFRDVEKAFMQFTNPYTGEDILELGKETELVQGENLAAIVAFSNGLKLNQPFRFVCNGIRYVLSNGETYTTIEKNKLVKIYIQPEQDKPGQNIHRYGVNEEPRGRGRLRQIEEQRNKQNNTQNEEIDPNDESSV
jgi:hypothetical protein